ncbi:Glyoxalase/Bleomycin resistance protein/Dioxygenase superfamily protein [Tistlia consotensis]|uniref:Glyoxalase/Bleomycin resistance protein/Dioxygenase superfamily protein n=1 Tax=Tistlia consotensis USBA 355 TaxID=560819 RepID=A0A1Y6BAG9_9PROT|nr:VOC family protein [Tistlia consotensis]SME99514.1 Glyoxalase/Bleomycin resistance protein/Dioxygenase superfamily protein [Tistlia consotensis USBA 355]SNR76694.1 Glyoxalase/Bleomycin resistance protein/Dioxygenase superfamily protein [Tistlia consotensis]
MSVTLNHTIVHARDCAETAAFLTEILGLEPPRRLRHFTVVRVGETSLDVLPADGEIAQHHFAFLVSEPEVDAIFARLRERGLTWWADPSRHEAGAINRWGDGRGLYFDDPDGHLLEILTRPYGSGGLGAEPASGSLMQIAGLSPARTLSASFPVVAALFRHPRGGAKACTVAGGIASCVASSIRSTGEREG